MLFDTILCEVIKYLPKGYAKRMERLKKLEEIEKNSK